MNFSIIIFVLGNILKVEGLLLSVPFIISLIYKESMNNTYGFLIVMAILFVIGVLTTIKKPEKNLCSQKTVL